MPRRYALPPSLSWVEIGRATAEGDAQWATWIAFLSGKDALYRTLVVADGSASVLVELQAQHPPVTRTLHRGGCRLPPETNDDGPIGNLLEKADMATRTALAPPEERSSTRLCAGTHTTAAPGERSTPAHSTSAEEDRRSSASLSGP